MTTPRPPEQIFAEQDAAFGWLEQLIDPHYFDDAEPRLDLIRHLADASERDIDAYDALSAYHLGWWGGEDAPQVPDTLRRWANDVTAGRRKRPAHRPKRRRTHQMHKDILTGLERGESAEALADRFNTSPSNVRIIKHRARHRAARR